ncbi:MAG: hypothetical protein WCO52_04215 [bacterium]
MSENICQQLRAELNELSAVKSRFDTALDEAVKSGNVDKANALKEELEVRVKTLQEKIWPFENLTRAELKRQFEGQIKILSDTHVIETLADGRLGIEGIDGKPYPVPELGAVEKLFTEARERFQAKIEQGFTKILLVPFGLSLDRLSQRFGETVLRHHQAGTLLATKKTPSDPDQPLELDENQPLWRWDQYNNADVSGVLTYDPEAFTANQGQTKTTLLSGESPLPGWRVVLVENLPNLPATGAGETINGRQQLEANKTPNEYLHLIKTEPAYTGESGLNPEEWLTYALSHLEETNQVIDDYQGNGKISYLLGAYFSAAEGVPAAVWDRAGRRAYLDRFEPDYRYPSVGARSAVRVA